MSGASRTINLSSCLAVVAAAAAHAAPANLRLGLRTSPAVAAVAGPANDSCPASAAISGAGPFHFDNASYTADGPPHAGCNVQGSGQTQVDRDAWFCWTAPQTVCPSGYVVETCGRTRVDTRIAVYTDCACPVADARLLGCADDECGMQTRVAFQAAPAQSYLIRVGTYPGEPGGPGAFVVRCAQPAPCAQPTDNCRAPDRFDALISDRSRFLTADDFSPAVNGAVSSVCWWGAYLDAADLNCQGDAPDAFEVRYFADADGVPGPLLGVFSQSQGTLSVLGGVATGDLIAGTVPEYAYTATHASLGVTAGQRYWIEISNAIAGCTWYWETAMPADERSVQDGTELAPPNGYGPEDLVTEDLAFCLNLPLPPPPANDLCTGARIITGVGEFDFDTTIAATDGPPHAACDFYGTGDRQVTHDVWYCWTAPCTETVFLRTCQRTAVDTRLAVYRGCQCPAANANLAACADDQCGDFQTMARFAAAQGQDYLIRVGSFPSAEGGTGRIHLNCGPPDHPDCPGTGSCCADQAGGGCCDERCCETVCACDPYCCTTDWDDKCATIGFLGTGCGAGVLCDYCASECGDPCSGSCCAGETGRAGCNDEDCCERVCACDPYCCNTEWDTNCAGNGFIPGCGAAALCGAVCGPRCPVGTVTWLDPPDGILDARRPSTPQNAQAIQGIQSLLVGAPPGAQRADCWTFCESEAGGNAIASVVNNGDGTVTINLAKPLTAGAVTRITYTDDVGGRSTGAWTFHPGNTNGDSVANELDVAALAAELRGGGGLPPGLFRRDINRSGRLTPADLLENVDLLLGTGAFSPWMSTPKPLASGTCPQ